MPEGTYTMIKPTNGSPPWMELHPKQGAYYYAVGGSVSTYKTASAIIILPSSYRLKGTGLGRNAYISFGVNGGARSIDIGIRNVGYKQSDAGTGWEPYCFETLPFKAHLFEDKRAPAGTKRARVSVTPNLSNKDYVNLSVEWLDGNNRVIDPSQNLIDEDIKLTTTFAWTQFYRFASLVSDNESATRDDSTYMLGGEFMDVKVGNANWGISTSTINTSWIISHPKCQLPDGYWATGEQFRIDHWA